MQLFYSENLKDVAQIFEIELQEHIHLTKVLRKSIGDKISVTNGKGQLFESEILSVSKKKTILKTISIITNENTKNLLSIAIAPTKNISRIEWFVEKNVEIGIDNIYIFTSQNSERRNVKIERLQLKALSAMKQSLKFTLPLIKGLFTFKNLIKEFNNFDVKLIASCEEIKVTLLKNITKNKKTIVLIGPEGGFSKEEIIFAKNNGFISVTLGSSRLRTETAGLYVCSVFNALN